MANRAGFEVQDSLAGRAGDINTQVSSTAPSTQMRHGQEIGMAKSEGEQIADSLSRFAPAGSKLLEGVATHYKEKRTKEGQVMAELGQELPYDSAADVQEGYESVKALNKHYSMVDDFEKWSTTNPQATTQEAQAKWTQLYGQTRDAVTPYGTRILDSFDANSAKAGRGYLKKHAAVNAKFVEDRSAVELGKMISGMGKAVIDTDPNSEEGKQARAAMTQVGDALSDNAVAGVQNRETRIAALINTVASSVELGNDTLLKIAEGMPTLMADPAAHAKISRMRDSVNKAEDRKVTAEKVEKQGVLQKMILEDGVSPKVAVAFSEEHGLHMTADEYWHLMNKREVEMNKAAIKEHNYAAILAGQGYAVELDPDKLSDGVNEVGQRIAASAATPEEGNIQRVAWLIKHGYEDKKLKAQYKAIASIPVSADGSASPQLKNLLSLWSGVKNQAAEGNDLSRQFGDETVTFLRDVEFYSAENSVDVGIAAREVQRLRADKPHLARTEQKIEAGVEQAATSWRDKYNIEAPRDIAAITERAKMMVRTGMATSVETAVESSVEKFRGDHTKVNGRWMQINPQLLNMKLKAGARVDIDGAKALKTHFDQPQVKKALGIEGTSFEQMSFVPTSDGTGVTVFVNDAKGVAYPVPGVHKFADIGRITVAAKLQEQTTAMQKGGRLDKDAQALDGAIRSVLGQSSAVDAGMYDPNAYMGGSGPRVPANTAVLNGMTRDDIGYNLAQWNSLDKETRYQEVVRLANYSAAKAAGRDTAPFSQPARVFKFESAKIVQPVEAVVNGLINAENGGDRTTFVRTRVTDGEISSAYGPMQVTKTLAEDVRKRLSHLFTLKEQKFLDRFIEQGELILKNGSNPLMKEQFGPGGIGTLSAEDKQMYIPVFTKVVKHYMEQYNNNPVRVASVWRYGEGKGSKQNAPAGYLMNFFRNIKS